ncbi:hypothetical protein LAZ67_X003843 [Cordylochernes scorpioides]|uniref:DNA helicase Pif1-like 2B domain-containing protein n=1 Tax=Cordylochernes scorpioides TaxID=51811 RepID=A0ABY6LUW2_9ARAC|nr:hypothetical protein LAZ67_X003843 [Cordylochernes scorpioides]
MWSMVAQRLTQITSPAATPDQIWQCMESFGLLYHKNTSNVFLNQCRGLWQRGSNVMFQWQQCDVSVAAMPCFSGTGMHPHRLNHKAGAIVMLLRNLNPKQSLCNSTRMVIQRMCSHVPEAQILTGTKGPGPGDERVLHCFSEPNLDKVAINSQLCRRQDGKGVVLKAGPAEDPSLQVRGPPLRC